MREYLRRTPALLAVLLLSVPSAIGVYAALLPTRGPAGALSAALGFECFYLGMSLIAFDGVWKYAALGGQVVAVVVAIALNTLASYSELVLQSHVATPAALVSRIDALRVWDGLLFAVALVESAPLALLALCGALLLHVLPPLQPVWAGTADPAAGAADAAALAVSAPQTVHAVQVNIGPAAALPRTLPAFIRARAASLPQLSAPALAAELRTSADTVRRALSQEEADDAA